MSHPKTTLAQAIEKSHARFNSKYSFVESTFVDPYTRMTINCPIHGEFSQAIATHLRSVAGCTKCGNASSKHNRTMSHEDYISRVTKLWGDKCDFTDTHYVNHREKVKVRCTIHDKYFTLEPTELSRGVGCARCGGTHRYTTEEYIEDCILIHGGIYGYVRCIYTGSTDPVTIWCSVHKEYFQQKATNHLRGHGCPKCGSNRRIAKTKLLQEDYISNCLDKHGDKFDLSEVVYIHSDEKVTVTCNICKHKFQVRAGGFVSSGGCKPCGLRKFIAAKRPLGSFPDFSAKAKERFNNKFYYDESTFKGFSKKMTMRCPDHGIFFQEPNDHLKLAHGCPSCADNASAEASSDTQESFNEKSIKAHGDKIDRSQAVYIDSATKVKLGCYKHGWYFQTPYAHIRGAGCPSCNESKGEVAIANYLDILGLNYLRQYKIPVPLGQTEYKHLRYDFYIPEHSVFIEFHGKQHYEYNPFFHRTNEAFQRRLFLDDIKVMQVKSYKGVMITLNYLHLENNKLLSEFNRQLKAGNRSESFLKAFGLKPEPLRP